MVDIDASVFARRRDAFMNAIGPRGAALIRSPPEATRNGDVLFPFRQSSDLFYLTGFAEPEAALVLRPGADTPFTLFVRPRDPEREVWTGRRAGTEGAVDRFGADRAFPISELERQLPELIADVEDLHYALGADPAFDRAVAAALATLRSRRIQSPPRRVVDPREVLHELRLIKSAEEVELLRRAAAITDEAHRAAMRAAGPGVGEYELEAVIDYTFRHRGGVGPGYPTIVGSGDNATILHYVENDRTLHGDELVLVDAGCEYGYYTADVTRTFPAGGRFSAPQRRVYELVLAAQEAAIEMSRPGIDIESIHARCVDLLSEGMVDLGLLPGPAHERVADGSYKRFFMHRTSHWLGMDVHDVGTYTRGGAPRPLEPGMVITVEPGLYIAADAQAVPDELRGIGVRIEDDILISDDGHENLTLAVPKRVADVEAACSGPT